jgi:hypothetical protein
MVVVVSVELDCCQQLIRGKVFQNISPLPRKKFNFSFQIEKPSECDCDFHGVSRQSKLWTIRKSAGMGLQT